MEKTYKIPELLSPAGSIDKAKLAISYGADAVYLGGVKFGLRAAADNLNERQLAEICDFAHQRNSLVFVVINAFPFDEDLKDLPDFLKYLEKIGVDALIISDLGAIKIAKGSTDIPLHLSTQASCINSQSAMFWKNFGIERIVLGREASLKDALSIKKNTGLEIESFIHGSMCMAYSGNCTISNFTQGRDSNRGGCAHSCRFEYRLSDKENNIRNDFFMSSKDLSGINLISNFCNAQIDSVKIEGRMKGPLYAATVTKVYRKALDEYSRVGFLEPKVLLELEKELHTFSHRSYTEANLVKSASADSVYDEREHDSGVSQVVGTVIESNDKHIVLEMKSKVDQSQEIEILTLGTKNIKYKANTMRSLIEDIEIVSTKPNQLVSLPPNFDVKESNVVRLAQ